MSWSSWHSSKEHFGKAGKCIFCLDLSKGFLFFETQCCKTMYYCFLSSVFVFLLSLSFTWCVLQKADYQKNFKVFLQVEKNFKMYIPALYNISDFRSFQQFNRD